MWFHVSQPQPQSLLPTLPLPCSAVHRFLSYSSLCSFPPGCGVSRVILSLLVLWSSSLLKSVPLSYGTSYPDREGFKTIVKQGFKFCIYLPPHFRPGANHRNPKFIAFKKKRGCMTEGCSQACTTWTRSSPALSVTLGDEKRGSMAQVQTWTITLPVLTTRIGSGKLILVNINHKQHS